MFHRIRCWTRVLRTSLACGFSAVLSLTGCGTKVFPPSVSPPKCDVHCLPVQGDTDGDLLTDMEEHSLSLDPNDPDEDVDLVRDGAGLAASVARAIGDLPEGLMPGQPWRVYKVTHLMRGLVICEVCAETMNMGYVEVVDPRTGGRVTVPVISLHYMSHGSFTAQATPEYGPRVDVVNLARTLALR